VVEEFGDPDNYLTLRLSPQKQGVIVTRADSQNGLVDLWMVDAARKLRTRLTFEDGLDTSPVWSPAENEIVFGSSAGGSMALVRKPLDGRTAPAPLGKAEHPRRPTDWSLDGKWIAFEESHPRTRRDLWIMPASGSGEPSVLAQSPFNEYQGQFSPDAKWLAYTSDETGRPEIYIRNLQGPDRPLRVSTDGGFQPRWKRDGTELYYLSFEGRLKAARITLDRGGKMDAAEPLALFDLASPGPGATDYRYDASADGRFLVIAPADDPAGQYLTVTVNWRASLQ
jgi:Tol biopolymer transport system component